MRVDGRDLRGIDRSVSFFEAGRPSARPVEQLPYPLLVQTPPRPPEQRLAAGACLVAPTQAAERIDDDELALHPHLAGGEARGVRLREGERLGGARAERGAGALDQGRLLGERVGRGGGGGGLAARDGGR